MKICYIWVEKFRNFENLGLNLSSNLKFYYNVLDNQIYLKEIEDIPTNFFGSKITDVTGIIGKNGAGKSNALELICKILKGGKTSLKTNFFLIIEEENELTCYYRFKNKSHPFTNINIFFEEYNGNINPLKIVFFSNVFDDRRNDFDAEISDISVNNLAYRRIGLSTAKRLTDFEKQIKFINSKIFKTLEIELPSKVQISSKVWQNKYSSNFERRMYGDNFDKINEVRKIFRDRIRELKPENKFIQLLKYGFFFDVYDNLTKNYGRKEYYNSNLLDEFTYTLNNLLLNESTDDITDSLMSFLEEKMYSISESQQIDLFGFDDDNDNPTGLKLIKKQIEFIKDIRFFVNQINLEYSSEGARNRGLDNFIFDYKTNSSKTHINEFITLFEHSNFIDVNWLGISSGHKAYLNLFSSIHNEIRYIRQQNLLICIDEGDLYLHPKWQIEFFDKLLKVLPNIYSGNIQLILTSHSPFLLSDLPKQNITILDKDIENSTLDGYKLKMNTFGGNLYDLYSEPFFLGNKRTSDFAYSKIKFLIEKVESKKYTNKEKGELIKLNDILGDEIIQYRINDLLKND